ncbi:MAG: zinc ribbon domain-containing protein [Deltaproteobacteria bacterium]|nr:zinc ribbon domain-containing protein [Deltaproteobacteria bacterium]
MASKETYVNCPSCGAKNPSEAKRCGACGATTEELAPVVDESRDKERRYQQEGFSLSWAGIALGVQAVLTTVIVVALPRAITALDFEGYYGMTLVIPTWFIGGVLVGMISPGKTFIEPVVAALIVAFPTIFYLYNGLFGMLGQGHTVRTMPIFMYVIMAMIGVMFSLIGSFVGERVQMGAPPTSLDA